VAMSRSVLWFLFAFLITSGHVHGSRGPLEVPMGRSAFIQPDDVIVASSRDRNVTSCVVKVADDNAATSLRVGTVTPTVHLYYFIYFVYFPLNKRIQKRKI